MTDGQLRGIAVSRIARLQRSVAGTIAAVVVGATALSGCAAGMIAQSVDQVAGVDGGSGDIGPIGIRNVLLATPQGANYAKGADAPVLLWVSNQSLAPETLSTVSSTVADSVAISGTATFPAQSITEIGGTAAISLTLKGLKQQLDYGKSIPMTFSFAEAGTITLNVPIAIPDQRDDTTRPTVDIQPEEAPNLWQSGAPETPAG